jgi:hypothetical protein
VMLVDAAPRNVAVRPPCHDRRARDRAETAKTIAGGQGAIDGGFDTAEVLEMTSTMPVARSPT